MSWGRMSERTLPGTVDAVLLPAYPVFWENAVPNLSLSEREKGQGLPGRASCKTGQVAEAALSNGKVSRRRSREMTHTNKREWLEPERAGNVDIFSRRHVLQAALAGVSLGFSSPVLSCLSAQAAERSGGQVLIVYYSRTGNTRKIAEYIHTRMGGEMLELKTAHTYPEAYRAVTEQARREQKEGFRPVLTTDVESVQPYSLIFIGYPNWWGTMPMALFSFLEKHDFSGKTLAPFCTHEGSALGRSERDIARLCPKARLLDGLAVRGSRAAEAQGDVDQWLRRIGLSQ